ncbi:MAG: DUF1513 domain-containing protein [Pseudomonadota bacterium]
MLTRRGILASLSASALMARAAWSAVGAPQVVTAAKTADGSFALLGLSASGAVVFQVPLPARGHAAAAHPHLAEVVAIARRPGTFAHVIDCAAGAVTQRLNAPPGRHFYGHGAFSSDGHALFTTENDIETGAGRVGIWARDDGYRRLGEVASGGIGPHEILRLPNETLAVANGGIRTHPDRGREKLNLATMRPNLTILSAEGRIVDQAEVAEKDHQNSLRHIAVLPNGTVVCGHQWQGDLYAAPSLVSLYRGQGELTPVEMDEALKRRMRGYIGSMGAVGAQTIVASAPRGDLITAFDLSSGMQASYQSTDVCGVASSAAPASVVTDGGGGVYRISAQGLAEQARHPVAFDNHAVGVTVSDEIHLR